MENKQYRLSCAFCGYTTLIDRLEAEDYKALTSWSIDWSILQVRNIEGGPGRPAKDPEQRAYQMAQRRGGFPIDLASCKSIIEMSKDPQWKELSALVANRVKRVYETYREAGLIK